MFNYRILSQGQYATMSVSPDGSVIIDAGEIPDGFTDTLWYEAEWSEWVGNIEDDTYHEIVHVLAEKVKVKEVPITAWSIDHIGDENGDVVEATEFTVTGTGVPFAWATLLFEKVLDNNEFPDISWVEIQVDGFGLWEYTFTAPDIDPNNQTPGQHSLNVRVRLQYGPRLKDKRIETFRIIDNPPPSNNN